VSSILNKVNFDDDFCGVIPRDPQVNKLNDCDQPEIPWVSAINFLATLWGHAHTMTYIGLKKNIMES
jgi:hypothetical protein